MFKNQNTIDPEEILNSQNFNPEKDLKINTAMIHTMAKDITAQEQSGIPKQPPATLNSVSAKISLDERQKNSPFLTPRLLNSLPPVQKASFILKEAPVKKTNHFATIFIAIIVIALTLGAGVYYFNITRQSEVAFIEPFLNLTQTNPLTTPQELIFSSEKPNYLPLDIDNLNSIQIQEILNTYAEKIRVATLTEPVEFIITDLQNNPIAFTLFLQKIGATLPENILSNLTATFSLFIFNDAGTMHFGLSIVTENKFALQEALILEEPSLSDDLRNILLFNADREFLVSDFADTLYKETAIRYQNIISPEELSIDYALVDSQLLIGTTQHTMYSIIDKALLLSSASQLPD